MFPKVPDQHKVGRPLIPNGLGVLFVLTTTIYLFILYFLKIPNASAPFTLVACILFGGFMGLLDDFMDLKWRYKAFMPLIAALPLIKNLPTFGIILLVAGGLAYTSGVLFFIFDSKFKYAHTIWHSFVVGGSSCHFFAVLNYAT